MTSKQIDKQIKRIMARFDFAFVLYQMKVLGWVWAETKGVPDIKEMRKVALGMLNRVAEQPPGIIATGGFYAEHNGAGFLRLWFALEEMDGRKGET